MRAPTSSLRALAAALALAFALAGSARAATQIGLFDTPGTASAVVLDGTLAYVADGAAGLRILDLANPEQPVSIGTLAPVTLGNVGDLALDGQLVFLAEGFGGFSVVDVSDPAHPVRTANVTGLGSVLAVAAADGHAFVGGNFAPSFHVYDVSDPANPVEIANPDVTALPRIQLHGGLAYAGAAIVDVSDPAAPVTIATSGAFHGAFGDGFGVSASPARVDLSDPLAPVAVSRWIRAPGLTPFQDVALAGELAFLVGSGGLSVFDASGLGPDSAPVSETTLDTGIEGGRRIRLDGDLAYVLANIADDLYVVDVADPAAPVVLGFLDGEFFDLAVDGDLLVTAESNVTSGLRVWDASIPGAPIQRSFLPMAGAKQLWLEGTRLYVIQSLFPNPRTLHVYDLSDPFQPVLLGSRQSDAAPLFLHPAGNRLYVAATTGTAQGALVVLDVANPAAIVELGRIATEGVAQALTVAGTRAYVASDAVEVFETVFPSAPQRIARWDFPGASFRDPEIDGTRLHVQSTIGWNFAVDLGDTLTPRLTGALAYGGTGASTAGDLAVANGFVFAASPVLRVYDGAAPSGFGPQERSSTPALAGARIALDEARELAAITAGAAGVRVVDIADDLAAWECANGRDDDGDGLVDQGADPGCRDGGDPSERPDCADGLDTDGDGHADFPADVSCADAGEASEAPNCDDGADSDGDGLVDFGADPGCLSRLSELEAPACQNGLDDDGDGALDFDGGAATNGGVPLGAFDADCTTAFRNTEQSSGCGLGAELALLLGARALARGRLRAAR